MTERLACESPYVAKMQDEVGHRGWKILYDGDVKDETAVAENAECYGYLTF